MPCCARADASVRPEYQLAARARPAADIESSDEDEMVLRRPTPARSLPAGLDPAVIAALSPADIASLMMALREQMSAGSSSADAGRS